MSNEHKPLTAAEIEGLRELEAKATKGELTQDDDGVLWCLDGLYGAFSTDQDTAYHLAMRNALPRLLAMLQPPTDAAVREAVERIWAEIGELPQYGCRDCGLHAEDVHTLLSYVRAVQSPRLTEGQVAVLRMLHGAADMRDAFRDEPGQALDAECRAAFPGVFGKEG